MHPSSRQRKAKHQSHESNLSSQVIRIVQSYHRNGDGACSVHGRVQFIVHRRRPVVMGIGQLIPVQPTSYPSPRPSRSIIENQIKIRPRIDMEKIKPRWYRPVRTGPPTPLQILLTNNSPLQRTRHPAPKQEIAIAIANKAKPENPPSPIRQVGEPRALAFPRSRFCREGSTASTRTLCSNHFLFQTVPQISSSMRNKKKKEYRKKKNNMIIRADPNPNPKIQSIQNPNPTFDR